MEQKRELNEWEQLLVAIASKLAWYNTMICKYDVRLIQALCVDLYMDYESFTNLMEDTKMLKVVRDVLVENEDGHYEVLIDYGFVKLGGKLENFRRISTRFHLYFGEGIVYKVDMDPLKVGDVTIRRTVLN